MQNKLQEEGFDDGGALDEAIKKLETDVKKARKKEADGEDTVVRSFPCVASRANPLVYRKNLRSR